MTDTSSSSTASSTSPVVRLERRLKHSPSAVWKALTTPSLLAKWWVPGEVRAEVGHRFELDMGKWGVQACEVLEVVAERRLVYTFILKTKVTWELIPDGDGTLLKMTHEGFDASSPTDMKAFEGVSGGWPVILERLDASLTG
jgi:uncharacterized protein YndB with AHSA1/START domain